MDYRDIQWWQVLIVSSLRYWIFAGLAYGVFYSWRRQAMFRYKIQERFPKAVDVTTEIKYSLSTIIIFGLTIYLVIAPLRPYTRIYNDIDSYSWIYYFLNIPTVILIHDTYFYWMHRLMHHRSVFKYVHRVHHRSHNPTPLAAFSFHPLEALVEVAVLPLIVFTLPVHRSVLGIFGLYMILMNVLGHLGFELFPHRFVKHPVMRFFNTSTHHNMHHHYGHGNYGLYFNFWDTLFKTNHERYFDEFERVSHRAERHEPVVDPTDRAVR
jgi:lathosterol oxidase